MTYLTRENSLESGAPFYLYAFESDRGSKYLVGGNSFVTYNDLVWEPAAISHSEVKSSEDTSKNSLTVSLPIIDTEFHNQFIGWTPGIPISMTLFRGHVSETELVVYWKGRISTVQLDENDIKITCESVFTSLKRAGLRPRFQKNCRHSLFDDQCRVVPGDYVTTGLVTAITGLSLTVTGADAHPDGWFNGGFIELGDGSTRQINSHIGEVINIDRVSRHLQDNFTDSGYGLGYGNSMGGFYVDLYPGCDRTLSTCKDKFDNLLNQGGFKWIPDKSPFDGTSII